ncbi:hypothetical protein KJ575_01775 [Patescibacteria group bacterium]|nr:hypothetical protein [Patescibacteria group bacterium]
MKLINRVFNSEFKNPKIPKIIFGIAAIAVIFFMALRPPTDPDLFWHLKTGELMWQYKTLPHIDWYSYTMSDFAWINHEWLSEILMFKIKEFFGWAGLAIFFALIITFAFGWLLPKSLGKNPLTLPRQARDRSGQAPFYAMYLLIILGAIVSSPTFGARPQMFTILGAALLFFVLNEFKIKPRGKLVYFLPIIFLLWANMHGGFILGLGLLAIYLALERFLIRRAKENPAADWLKSYQPLESESWKKLAYLALISFGTTFLNPYGPRIYEEIFRTFSDVFAQNVILEWLAPNFHQTEGILFGFYVIFVFIILSLFKKIDIFSFVLIPLFLFLAFQAVRNIPIFVIISLPFLIANLSGLENIFEATFRKKIITLGFGAMLIFYAPHVYKTGDVVKTFKSEEKLAEYGEYPREAVKFLQGNPRYEQKNIFNDYGWGGYMIGNVKCQMSNVKCQVSDVKCQMSPPAADPPKAENVKSEEVKCEPRVFVDGRMAQWKTKDRHILKDYQSISALENNWQELVEQYKIGVIFVKKESYLGRALKFNSEWQKIYEDDLAVIYEN